LAIKRGTDSAQIPRLPTEDHRATAQILIDVNVIKDPVQVLAVISQPLLSYDLTQNI